MGFPTQVNTVQAPAVEGDFADSNPRATVDAGPGALVAGTGGVTVGRFAWADATMSTVLNAGSGAPTGFVARSGQLPLITTYLADNGNVVPAGQPITLHSNGGFFVKNNNASGDSVVAQKVFASLTTGQVRFAAAGATVAGYIETKFMAISVGAVGELVKITSHVLG